MSSPATQSAALARPGRWAADAAACTVTFAVRDLGIHTVTGQLPVTSADVTVDGHGQPARIRAELDIRRIDTGNRRRDADLRGARFFDADRWPSISFEATAISPCATGWTVEGQLTVKDVTSPVRLEVTEVRAMSPDPASPVSLRATGSLDRRTAGITAGPGFLIGHAISLSLTATFRPASD
jgi:polyisoprenoid-binding protein YceI